MTQNKELLERIAEVKKEGYSELFEPYAPQMAELCLEQASLLREVLNSDMAAREEDEGNVNELLDKIREAVA